MRRHLTRLAISFVLAAGTGLVLRAQDPGAATEEAAPGESLRWPRVVVAGDTTFTVYQPQIDKFDDAMLEARAAVKVDTKVGDKTQTSYGVVWITAQTQIDKENEPRRALQHPGHRRRTSRPPPRGPRSTLRSFRKQHGGHAHDLPRARRGEPRHRRRPTSKGNAVPLKNDPPPIYYRTHARASRPDRRRSRAPAGRGRLRPPARRQHEEPHPRSRRHLLHVARRPLAPGAGRDRALAARGLGPAVRPGRARRHRQGRKPDAGRPHGGPGRGGQGGARRGQVARDHRQHVPAELIVDAGQAADEADRRDAAPLRREHDGRHLPRPRGPELLRHAHRPLVPLEVAREGPLAVRRRRPTFPPDFAKIPDQRPEGERPRDRPRHARGPGGRDRQQHPADGRGQPRGGEVRGEVRRRAASSTTSRTRRSSTPSTPRRRSCASPRRPTTRCRAASGSRAARRSGRGSWRRSCRP